MRVSTLSYALQSFFSDDLPAERERDLLLKQLSARTQRRWAAGGVGARLPQRLEALTNQSHIDCTELHRGFFAGMMQRDFQRAGLSVSGWGDVIFRPEIRQYFPRLEINAFLINF